MYKVWASVVVLATLYIIPNIAEKGNSSQKIEEEVKKWPKVFVLSYNPAFPVVCYSGDLVVIPLNQTEGNSSTIKNAYKTFNLSSDPQYPVTCRVEPIPQHLANDHGTGYEKVTCVRRDYEGGISAVFFFKAGPLKEAWNVFNSTMQSSGYVSIKDVNAIDPEPNILKEMVVASSPRLAHSPPGQKLGSEPETLEYFPDCTEYGIPSDDKCIISAGAAASLCG